MNAISGVPFKQSSRLASTACDALLASRCVVAVTIQHIQRADVSIALPCIQVIHYIHYIAGEILYDGAEVTGCPTLSCT